MIKEILKEYQLKRDDKIYEAEQRTKAVYEQIPRLREIEELKQKAGLKLGRACLGNPLKSQEITKQYYNYINQLNNEKEQIYINYNMPTNYLDVQYDCKECEDTGFVREGYNSKKCKCLEQKLISALYKDSNMENTLNTCNFDNFDFNRFSKEVIEGEKESAYDSISEAYKTAKRFVNNFDENKEENLLFTGSTGVGKTFLSSCIARELLDRGKTVVYQKSSKLAETLESYRFNRSNPSLEISQRYNQLYNCDLLIIDDLGSEEMNKYILEEFFTMMDTRLMNKKRVIISSNLDAYTIDNIYGRRILSRIAGNYNVIKFSGEDLRWEA